MRRALKPWKEQPQHERMRESATPFIAPHLPSILLGLLEGALKQG
jgi:hypothetical protein